MTESEAKCNVARGINKILSRIYNNISESGVDLHINFSDISSESLKDYGVYTAGFLGIKTTEELKEMLSEDEIQKLLEGEFSLKRLSLNEAYAIAESAGKKLSKAGFNAKTELYKIQDGTYFVNKNMPAPNSQGYINCITLKTNPVEYYTHRKYFYISPDDIFSSLRNTFAHSTPYLADNKILFVRGDDEIVVTKMWLRGYSELFSRKSSIIEAKDIMATLRKALPTAHNYLETPEDIDKAINVIKDLFPSFVKNSFFRVNNFVKNRVLYNKNFYTLNLDAKIAILSAICEYNPHYLVQSSETPNSRILYNLRQLIGQELENRNEYEMLTSDDEDIKKLTETILSLREVEETTNEFLKNNPSLNSQWMKRKYQDLINKKKSLMKEQNALLNKLILKKKLESSNMNIYDKGELKYLPVEVATNIVFLLGFNNLVTSAFYEDLLGSSDLNQLNKERSQFFASINLEKFTRFYNDQKTPKNYSPEQTAFMLYVMRQALCHGNISYSLPPVKKGASGSFKDVILTFYGDWQNVKITGRLEDFYNLFISPVFTNRRAKSLLIKDEVLYSPNSNKENPEIDEPSTNEDDNQNKNQDNSSSEEPE